MLVLFETAAGFALFKLLDEKKLKKADDLYADFETPERASKIVKLKHFQQFLDTTEALAAVTSVVEGKLSKSLKKLLKKEIYDPTEDKLLVADAKLGNVIKEKLNITCLSNNSVNELCRCIRSQATSLITDVGKDNFGAMSLGLAHSLSRYKLKFSPDKIDTMIVQAVTLLDDLDKDLNNYIMRTREWYGWHFPEMGVIIEDNIQYIKTVKLVGTRDNVKKTDFSDILSEDVEDRLKNSAEVSVGTEISEMDLSNIWKLCDQVLEISSYRAQLYDYLKSRMMAIAPNMTILLGELIAARLISKAGSLIALAKYPASTIQILGAEKALFRALKVKRETPKYGIIFHSSLVGQSSTAFKGKMARMLACKTALACRFDALGDDVGLALGAEHKIVLENRLRMLEEGCLRRISGTAKAKAKFEKYHGKPEVEQYYAAVDSTLKTSKRKFEELEDEKVKIEPLDVKEEQQVEELCEVQSGKKKKRKHQTAAIEEGSQEKQPEAFDEGKTAKKKKKKQQATVVEEDLEVKQDDVEEPPKKKKKKQQPLAVEEDEVGEADEVKFIKKKKKKNQASANKDGEDLIKPEPEFDIENGDVQEEPVKKKRKKKKSLNYSVDEAD